MFVKKIVVEEKTDHIIVHCNGKDACSFVEEQAKKITIIPLGFSQQWYGRYRIDDSLFVSKKNLIFFLESYNDFEEEIEFPPLLIKGQENSYIAEDEHDLDMAELLYDMNKKYFPDS